MAKTVALGDTANARAMGQEVIEERTERIQNQKSETSFPLWRSGVGDCGAGGHT